MITRLSKQALLVTAALLAFSFSACTSGDDDDSPNSDTSNQQQQGDNSGNQQQAAVVLTDATAAQAVSAIQGATGAVRISTGALTEDDLFSLADALKANTSARVTLNLSNAVLTEVSARQFEGCVGLISITLPEGIKKIPDRAFLDCTNLQSLAIPKSVTEFDNYGKCVGGCANLTNITVAADSKGASAPRSAKSITPMTTARGCLHGLPLRAR